MQESKELFRIMADTAPVMIWMAATDMCYYFNQVWLDFTGQTLEQQRLGWAEGIHPEDLQQCLDKYLKAFEERQKFCLEYRRLRADGEYRWIFDTANPQFEPDSSFAGYIGSCVDISERKQAEEALQNTNKQLEIRIAECTTELKNTNKQLQLEIAKRQPVEKQLDITECKQVEEALRQSETRFRELAQREKLLNRLANQIRRSLDLNIILETAVQEIYRILQVERCLFIWYRPDEEAPYWEIVQEARHHDLPSYVGFCTPVTEICSMTAKAFNKKIIRVNDTTALTNPVEQQFYLSLGSTATLEIPIHTQSGGVGVISCSYNSGCRFWTDSEVELLQAVTSSLAIAIDQAELYKQSHTAAATAKAQAQQLKETLQKLQQTQTQLIQTEKMSSLGQMVAGIAHEINNPVNFIYGNISHANEYTQDLLHLLHLLHLYQQRYPQPDVEIQYEIDAIDLDFLIQDLPKVLFSMRVGAIRIREIVLSLRNFSRLDEAEMKQVEIHEGIDSTLLILDYRLKAKPENFDIEVVKEYGNLPKVECYAGQLNQVFMNLLANAIDALEQYNTQRTPEEIRASPSIIRICTELIDSERVQIRIADNGFGMTEAVRLRLFDPFFTTKPVGKGTGLGLSISYQIVVEKHGGNLQCISAPGQGAEFVISIPIRQPCNGKY